VIAARPAFRVIEPPDREDRSREAAFLIASVAVDAVAAEILLVGTPLPRPLEALAASLSHGMAVSLLFGLSCAQPSRRWLSAGALLAVPLFGAAAAVAMFATRGRGSAGTRRRRRPRRSALTAAALKRLADSLSPCDALDCGDDDERCEALSALSRRDDPETIALLRRVAGSRDSDLALSAALALDEIGERAEHQRERLDPGEVHRVAG
jgi:hypothetical protein